MPLTTYVANEVLTAASLNANFNYAVTVPAAPSQAIFNETQASTTNGGTATSGSFVKRTLNTTIVNNITGCSISSSVITLAAGTYRVEAYAPVYRVNSQQLRFFNNTASAILGAPGNNLIVDNTGDNGGIAILDTYFTLTVSSACQLEQRVQTTVTNAGYGNANGFSTSEIYAQVTLTKVA